MQHHILKKIHVRMIIWIAILFFAGIMPVIVSAEISAAESGSGQGTMEAAAGEQIPAEVVSGERISAEATAGEPTSAEAAVEELVREEETEAECVTSSDSTEPDEMFAGYVEQVFYGSMQPSAGKRYARRVTQGSRLSEWNRCIYDQLVEKVSAVAGGELETTEFTFDLDGFVPLNKYFTAADLGVSSLFGSDGKLNSDEKVLTKLIAANGLELSLNSIINALLSDYPYEVYWYDKTHEKAATGSYLSSYTKRSDGSAVRLTRVNYSVKMVVSQNYARTYEENGSTYYYTYTADAATTSRASDAAENARRIVAENTSLPDYDKLVAYKDAICGLTAYNRDAADNSNGIPYGDPWQMVYVFDNDPDTNVVCEGYSKAFQYLCDQSTFEGEVVCNTMTGKMTGGTGAGGHMWNVVSISCGNYIADITNSDSGTVGYASAPADCPLFLKGSVTNADAQGYTLPTRTKNIVYQYDKDTVATFTEAERLLSESAYDPAAPAGHDWDEGTVIKEAGPGCLDTGEIRYVCKRNGYHTKTEVILPAGHSLKEIAPVEPTCETDGTIQHWKCEVCGKRFADDAGEQEITEKDTIIPATGHDLTEVSGTEVTCTTDGTRTYWHCSRCNRDYADAQASQIFQEEERQEQEHLSAEKQRAAEAAAEEAAGHKTLAAVEKSITTAKSDSDPSGTVFAILAARVTAVKKNSLKIQWNKVIGAAGYVIYANRCGKNNRYVKVKELKGRSNNRFTLTKINGKKLKKNTYYKILVAAYRTTSYGEKRILSAAKVIHAATAGGKLGNPTKLTVSKKKLTIKKKQKVKLIAKQKGKTGIVIKKHRAVCFESSDPKIASVTKKGVVKGLKKGSCQIYVYSQSGLYKRVKITVR